MMGRETRDLIMGHEVIWVGHDITSNCKTNYVNNVMLIHKSIQVITPNVTFHDIYTFFFGGGMGYIPDILSSSYSNTTRKAGRHVDMSIYFSFI